MGDVFGGIKKGDTVLVVHISISGDVEHKRSVTVQSVGPKHITIKGGERFSTANGRGEYSWSLHTESTLDAHIRRMKADRSIRNNLAQFMRTAPIEAVEHVAELMSLHHE